MDHRETQTARAAAVYIKAAQAMLDAKVQATSVGVSAIAVGADVLKLEHDPEAVALWLEGFAFAIRTGKTAPQMPSNPGKH